MTQVVRMMVAPAMVRQGDVLVVPLLVPLDESDLGELLESSKNKRVVLAHGEVTGHAHAFYAEDLPLPVPKVDPVRLFALKGDAAFKYGPLDKALDTAAEVARTARVLRLGARALLKHEEHSPISFPAGDYLVLKQHESDDFVRAVAD